MVSIIMDSIDTVNRSKFFNDEERRAVNDHLRMLVRGKVGDAAASNSSKYC